MYEKEYCPNCKTLNLVYLGDWNDCTCPDVEAAECYKCGHVFLMGDEDNRLETLRDIVFLNVDMDDALKDAYIKDVFSNKEKLSVFLREYAFTQKGEKCV